MKIIYGPQGPFSWACSELAHGLMNMMPTIREVADAFEAENCDKDVTIFVLLACPCCERSGLRESPENSIDVTPYKGMDMCGHKVEKIDIYPPFRRKDGIEEAKDAEQFAKHWRETLEKAVA